MSAVWSRLVRVAVAATAVVAALPSCANLDGLTGGGDGLGAKCGNHVIEPGEACDGDACCTAECTFAAAGTSCRPAIDPCDVAETCSGTSAACPVDAFAAAGTVCRPASAACDAAEVCSGTGPCPPDTTTCASSSCRPNNACTAPQTCTGTDDLGCALACACADEGVYSCTNSCCAEPAVAGKSCTPATAACNDACNRPCTCTGGTWSCAGACNACPETAPNFGATAYADVGTTCAYTLANIPLAVRTCVGASMDGASNTWTCADAQTFACTSVAMDGKACSTTASCGDACGQLCTCTATGLWSCPATCNACPSIDALPLDGKTCASSAGTVCTYAVVNGPKPVSRCTCTPSGTTSVPNTWTCTDEDACPSRELLPLAGKACAGSLGTTCNYELDSGQSVSCSCSALGTWSCP